MAKKQAVKLPRFIKDILDLAQKHDFNSGGPKKPVTDEKSVIEKMTPFEKACYILNGRIREQYVKNCYEMDHTQSIILLEKGRTLKELMWCSIKERLGENCPATVGICDGWKIIKMEDDNEECGCIVCMMKNSLSDKDGVTVIELGETGSGK